MSKYLGEGCGKLFGDDNWVCGDFMEQEQDDNGKWMGEYYYCKECYKRFEREKANKDNEETLRACDMMEQKLKEQKKMKNKEEILKEARDYLSLNKSKEAIDACLSDLFDEAIQKCEDEIFDRLQPLEKYWAECRRNNDKVGEDIFYGKIAILRELSTKLKEEQKK